MDRFKKLQFWILALFALFIACIIIANPGSLFTQEQEKDISKNPIPMTPESIEIGKTVFFENCAGCHGRRADGRGRQSLNLIPKPQNLRNAQFVKYLTDERMYTSISGGVRGTSMPAFTGILVITPEKRWHVINYIRSLTADDTLKIPNSIAYREVASNEKNPVAASEASIAKGKNLFLNYCANCHGPKADGKGKLSASLIPAPRNLVVVTSWGEKPFVDYLSDARMFDSIINGVPGTSMQPWIGVFSEQDIWNIINYFRAEAKKQVAQIDVMYQ